MTAVTAVVPVVFTLGPLIEVVQAELTPGHQTEVVQEVPAGNTSLTTGALASKF